MQVQCYTLGNMGTHCYFLINEETKEALVVDPAAQAAGIISRLEQQGLILKGILLTHGHGDHIMAVPELKARYEVPVLAHEAEEGLLADPGQNLTQALFGQALTLKADQWLKDGDLVELAGLSLKVFHTPGHTPGGCCYYDEVSHTLISGDTLFYTSIGRTDFPGGSLRQLVSSIQEKLMPLPDETKVYPGHSELTTIGQERRYNPYIVI